MNTKPLWFDFERPCTLELDETIERANMPEHDRYLAYFGKHLDGCAG